jgi:outer membrane protein TolC
VPRWGKWVRMAAGLATCVGTSALGYAQGTGPITLRDAVEAALKHYPALNESRARAEATEGGIALARTAYLPRLDVLGQ